MWPTNSWHGNVPKAHFFPPILRMTGPLRILLAIIRKGEGGCTCKWMINIKQMNFKMIRYLPAEIKCAMVRRWLAVQKIFCFFPQDLLTGQPGPKVRWDSSSKSWGNKFVKILCRDVQKQTSYHTCSLCSKSSHQRLRSPIVRFFALLQMGGKRKNFFQEFRLLLRSVLFAAFLIKKRVAIHMDCKDFI